MIETPAAVWKSWPGPSVTDDMWLWQAGRCAWCGNKGHRRGIVLDHCHKNGLARGFLCRACNTREGYGPDEMWGDWRRGDNPALTFGFFEVYADLFTGSTRFSWTSPLWHYTKAERETWWLEAEVEFRDGVWPTPPWTEAALARKAAEWESLKSAINAMPSVQR